MEDIANALGINFIQLFSEPKIISNTFNESPHSIGNIETQQNHSSKDIWEMMLSRLDLKEEQLQNFITTQQANMQQLIKELLQQRK